MGQIKSRQKSARRHIGKSQIDIGFLSSLYNQDLKIRYIDYVDSCENRDISPAEAFSVLREIRPFEVRFGKDACAFSEEEMSEAFVKIYPDNSMKYYWYYQVYRYIKWCFVEAVPDVNEGLLRYSPVPPEAVSRMVFNAAALKRILDGLSADHGDGDSRFGYRFKCCAWLGFVGVHEKDLEGLSIDGIDTDGRVINSLAGERQYPYCAEAADDISAFVKQAKSAGQIMFNPGREVIFSGSMIEWYNSVAENAKKSLKYTNTELSYDSLFMYGMFYRMFQYEISSGNLKYAAYAEEAIRAVGDLSIYDAKDMTLRIMESYAMWKLAFITR